MLKKSKLVLVGGEILASQSLEEAYSTGRGPITVRGRALIEQEGADGKKKKGSGPPRSVIVITELPFQTNKAALVEHIAELANEDKVLQGELCAAAGFPSCWVTGI